MWGVCAAEIGGACSSFCIDVDMANAFFSLLAPNECGQYIKYQHHTNAYRTMISAYYGIPECDAKVLLLKALFGYVGVVGGKENLGVLPVLYELAAACSATKARLAVTRPELQQHFVNLGRRDPKASTLTYILMDREHQVLSDFIHCLGEFDFQLVCPIFDGAIVTSKGFMNDAGSLQAIAQRMFDMHGISFVQKQFVNLNKRRRT